jgi:hypothetical protein
MAAFNVLELQTRQQRQHVFDAQDLNISSSFFNSNDGGSCCDCLKSTVGSFQLLETSLSASSRYVSLGIFLGLKELIQQAFNTLWTLEDERWMLASSRRLKGVLLKPMAEHNNRFSTLGKDGVRQHIWSSRDGLFSIVFTRPTTESWRPRLLGNRPVSGSPHSRCISSQVGTSPSQQCWSWAGFKAGWRMF